MNKLPVSPLSLNQLTRDYWGHYDAAIIAQLSALATNPCYRIKFYKAPEDDVEVFTQFGYATYGMRVKPGSLLFGLYLPLSLPAINATFNFTVQVTDVSTGHKWFDDPVSNLFLSNVKPEFQSDVNWIYSATQDLQGSPNSGGFPSLLCAPYPVVGSGQFDVEIQSAADYGSRIQLVFGALEKTDVG